jgi:hypothetical protein
MRKRKIEAYFIIYVDALNRKQYAIRYSYDVVRSSKSEESGVDEEKNKIKMGYNFLREGDDLNCGSIFQN